MSQPFTGATSFMGPGGPLYIPTVTAGPNSGRTGVPASQPLGAGAASGGFGNTFQGNNLSTFLGSTAQPGKKQLGS